MLTSYLFLSVFNYNDKIWGLEKSTSVPMSKMVSWVFDNGFSKTTDSNQPKNIVIDNGIQNKIIHQFITKCSTPKSNQLIGLRFWQRNVDQDKIIASKKNSESKLQYESNQQLNSKYHNSSIHN